MRNWHRWTMTVVGLVLAYWVSVGLLLAVYDATDAHPVWTREGGGPGAPLYDAATMTVPVPEPTTLAAGVAAAQTAAGPLVIASVDLRWVPHGLRLQLADASGSRATMRRYYAATGLPMSEQMADEEVMDASRQAHVARRNLLKSFHKGDVAGLPGQAVGVLAGLGLLALTVSGFLLYAQLWRARRRVRKSSLFWSGPESRWRRLHRWIAVVAAVFLLNIALTGTVLALAEFKLSLFLHHGIGLPPYPRPTPLPPVSASALPRDLNAMLSTVYRAAQLREPTGRIVGIQLVERDGQARGLVIFGGNATHVIACNAVTGATVADWATSGFQSGNGYFADWHQVLKRMHRGDIIGWRAGRYLDLSAGLALLYLVVSGTVMYLQLLGRRRAAGRSGFFWK
jgi:uncharacterized iron-regulated membrane protein